MTFILKRGERSISVVYPVYLANHSRVEPIKVGINTYRWFAWGRDPNGWRVRVTHNESDPKFKDFGNEVEAATWVYSRAKSLGAEL